ncbi:MAG: hypothetical protein KIH69_004710 [Anaerolineae bacterium]|nr:hypothetical protein [Anaerolineae bacterium]
MDKKLIGDVLKLKQVDKDLVVFVERIRAFLPLDENDDESPLIRPYGLFVLERNDVNPRFFSIFPSPPSVEDVLLATLQAMLKPMTTIGRAKPWRAKRVFFISETLADALKADLTSLSVEVATLNDPNTLKAVKEIMAQFNALLGGESNPDLLKIAGMTVPMLGEYFEVAAAYYEAEPWRHLWNEDIVEIRYGDHAKPYYASLIGFGNEEFGLALYASIEDLEKALEGIGPQDEAEVKKFNLFSLLYASESILGFEDLEAIEKYDWPIPNSEAYPGIIRAVMKKGITLPTFKEMLLMSAALRMLPTFVSEEMRANGETPKAATKTYDLPSVYGQDKISFRYPRQGATIEVGDRIQDEDDEWEDDVEKLPILPEQTLLALAEKIDRHLPFRVELPKELLKLFKQGGIPIGRNTAFQAIECRYVDEYDGIMLNIEIDKRNELEVQFAFAKVDKKHPLYPDWDVYSQAYVEAQPDDEDDAD